jgi:hypothetical protein
LRAVTIPSRRLAALVLAGALVALAACGDDDDAGGDASGGDVACGPTEPALEDEATHVPAGVAVDYEHHPPAAGPHPADVVPVDGVYGAPLSEPEQVAALELGMVVVSYAPTLPADAVAALATLTEEFDDVIVTPAAAAIDDGRLVAAVAWEQRQLCDGVDLAVLRGFIRTWVGVAAS